MKMTPEMAAIQIITRALSQAKLDMSLADAKTITQAMDTLTQLERRLAYGEVEINETSIADDAGVSEGDGESD